MSHLPDKGGGMMHSMCQQSAKAQQCAEHGVTFWSCLSRRQKSNSQFPTSDAGQGDPSAMPPCQAGKAARSVIGGFDEPKLSASIILFERLSRDEEWCESKSFSCWEKVAFLEWNKSQPTGKSSRKTGSVRLIHNLGSPSSKICVWQLCNDWGHVC